MLGGVTFRGFEIAQRLGRLEQATAFAACRGISSLARRDALWQIGRRSARNESGRIK
jgi:hypothetical protein